MATTHRQRQRRRNPMRWATPLTLTLDVQQNIGKLECKVIICVNVQAAGKFTNTK